MSKCRKQLENLDSIFEDVKFTSNSFIRLKILATLFKKPQNMKELTDNTHLSYSSVSSNMHDLELRGFIYREHNKYFLTNSSKIRIENLLEFNRIVLLLNDFFNILDGHTTEMIPRESVLELYLLEKADLMESDGVDAYRVYNFIENCLASANKVKGIMPFYYMSFFSILEKLACENKNVELMVADNIFKNINENFSIDKLSCFNSNEGFLLICTDDIMILGFFVDDGQFDQNRLLVSKNKDSIKWANNLFKNFKNNK